LKTQFIVAAAVPCRRPHPLCTVPRRRPKPNSLTCFLSCLQK
jgi:hypothetical protein